VVVIVLWSSPLTGRANLPQVFSCQPVTLNRPSDDCSVAAFLYQILGCCWPMLTSSPGLCRRRGWHDPLYECSRTRNGYTCHVLVNGLEYLTDLAYESDGLAQENAAMRAFMICRNFSVNGGMLARNGVVQGLPASESRSRHRRKDDRGRSSRHSPNFSSSSSTASD
jgi:hypothetical protein